MLTTAIYTREAKPADRTRLEALMHYAPYLHNHLDWSPPYDWLGKHPFQLALIGDTLIGALAAPPDPPGVAWIRLAAVADGYAPEFVLDSLWETAREPFLELSTQQVNCMLLEAWLAPHIERWGFEHLANVVILKRRRGAPLPVVLELSEIIVRPARSTDLNAIARVDSAAFGPPWQYSRTVIQQAIGQCSRAMVAEVNGEIVGYEISSGGRQGGHLARLAVEPAMQGRGIGRLLVRRMIEHFERKGAAAITVNTQADNASSIAVYRAAGFELTGEGYSVSQYRFDR